MLTPTDIPATLQIRSPDRRKGFCAPPEAWSALIARQPPVMPDAGRIAAQLSDALAASKTRPEDAAVTLLIDQSGLMKGDPIVAAVAAVDRVVDALATIGLRSEVLGFSTAGWHGGYARAQWIASGRPPRPGRLCALLHLIYKPLGTERLNDVVRRSMLHPDILREGVDGEALAWAASRLACAQAKRRLLLVLSDGAPLDDSTLLENGAGYLERHLRSQIALIDAETPIDMGAVGIGYDVDRYYPISRRANLDEIVEATTDVLIALLEKQSLDQRSISPRT